MLEEDLRSKIAIDSGVSAKVAKASIAWGDRPQASKLPAITLEIVAAGEDQHMLGTQALQRTMVQADVWSLDRLVARDVRLALVAAVVPLANVGDTRFARSFVVAKSTSFEQLESGSVIYRERVDFDVWHASLA